MWCKKLSNKFQMDVLHVKLWISGICWMFIWQWCGVIRRVETLNVDYVDTLHMFCEQNAAVQPTLQLLVAILTFSDTIGSSGVSAS
jgi:hypothetical protein